MRLLPRPIHVLIHTGLIALLLATTLTIYATEETSAASRVITFDTFDIDEPIIALTFDVTFDRGDGPMILDILADRNVPATFAITGLWAQRNPDLMRRIVNEGHHMMNHTWDHPSLTGEFTGSRVHQPRSPLAASQVQSQLQRTEDLVREQVGVELKPWVRPPYGDYDDAILEAMAEIGYIYNIMWTADTFGWYGDPVNVVQQRAFDAAQPGANILMHVGHGATDGAALPGIIDGLRAMGYEFATIEDMVEGELGRSVSREFPDTGETLTGDFLLYWQRFGGSAVFGDPISPKMEENGVTVQYFEQARFEHRPGTWPERFDVQLTRLGTQLTRTRVDKVAFRPVQDNGEGECRYFPQTRHSLCDGLLDHWERFGGLAVFGYPISESYWQEDIVTGETFQVQYFERQRFELRSGEVEGEFMVRLSSLGEQARHLAERHDGRIGTREPRLRGWPEVLLRPGGTFALARN